MARVVAIGSSTGGVEALIDHPLEISRELPADGHQPAHAADLHAKLRRALEKMCAPEVSEAVEGAMLTIGHVYLAPGSAHLEVTGPHRAARAV